MQALGPPEAIFSKELLREEIESFLQKGVILLQTHSQEGFYSTLFLVPKKNGQTRPVINLQASQPVGGDSHFKMEGISTLRNLLRTEDWMVKVDLKDAYFTISSSTLSTTST